MKTAADFYKEYNGRAIDYDGAYNIQCVDGFRIFCDWIGVPSVPTPSNYADGYFLQFDELKIRPYFERVGRPYQNGDWVIWKRGSASHPSSHIAMFYNDYEFGENQGGDRGFCLKKTDFSDALGALRLRRWSHMDGWKKENGDWYYYVNGEPLKGCFHYCEWKGVYSWYQFDKKGRCSAQIKFY